jgi:hypothetical protein
MMEIRSYRRVFDLERRIYQIDRLRLNPSGIPVRGVVYFLALVAGSATAARAPGLAALVAPAPWYLRDVALPALVAAALTLIRIERRPFHLAVSALLRQRLGAPKRAGLSGGRPRPRALPGGRWHPPPILMLPDGSDARVRKLRYTGPGAVVVAVPHRRHLARAGVRRRCQLAVEAAAANAGAPRPQVIELERSARMRVG